MSRYTFSVFVGFMLSTAFAYDVAFTNSNQEAYNFNIPVGWQLISDPLSPDEGTVTMMNSQPQNKFGNTGLGIDFYSASGTNILCTTNGVIKSNEVVCDNVVAHICACIQKAATRVDVFQIVISTNNWSTYERIGAPILLAEDGRSSAEWLTFERVVRIPGLSSWAALAVGNDVAVGILAGAPSKPSGRYEYVHSVDLDFVAIATPQDVCFTTNGILGG